MKRVIFDHPVFKGMDLQNKGLLIYVGDNGIFLAKVNRKKGEKDVEITYKELYKLLQEVKTNP
jgi:hypothetical protein